MLRGRMDGSKEYCAKWIDPPPRLLAHELSPLSVRRDLPASVPETTVYTRSDRVIDWQSLHHQQSS
jgi:hypothetical protein